MITLIGSIARLSWYLAAGPITWYFPAKQLPAGHRGRAFSRGGVIGKAARPSARLQLGRSEAILRRERSRGKICSGDESAFFTRVIRAPACGRLTSYPRGSAELVRPSSWDGPHAPLPGVATMGGVAQDESLT